MIRSPSCAGLAAALNGLQFGELDCNILLMEAPMVHDILFSLRSLAARFFFRCICNRKTFLWFLAFAPKMRKMKKNQLKARFVRLLLVLASNNPPMTTAHICSSRCVSTVARVSRPSELMNSLISCFITNAGRLLALHNNPPAGSDSAV